MKFVLLALLALIHVISGDRCGSQITKMEKCMQISMRPSTTNLKKALSACFRRGCTRVPDIRFVEAKDGNAVTECLNQGLKSKGGPVIARCMSKKFPGWKYPTPPGTFVPGSPEAIFRAALNRMEDSKICPRSAQQNVGKCLEKGFKDNIPKPNQARDKRNFCTAKRKCSAGISSACIKSIPQRSVSECRCSAALSSRAKSSVDSATMKCLATYMPAGKAREFMTELKKNRSTEKPKCTLPKQTEDQC